MSKKPLTPAQKVPLLLKTLEESVAERSKLDPYEEVARFELFMLKSKYVEHRLYGLDYIINKITFREHPYGAFYQLVCKFKNTINIYIDKDPYNISQALYEGIRIGTIRQTASLVEYEIQLVPTIARLDYYLIANPAGLQFWIAFHPGTGEQILLEFIISEDIVPKLEAALDGEKLRVEKSRPEEPKEEESEVFSIKGRES